MRHLKHNTSGITLTELLVASVLVGIVMLGVAGFSVSIKQMQASTNQTTVLAMRARAALARMVKDASLAVGDNENCGTEGLGSGNVDCGLGIRWVPIGPPPAICFRHDRSGTPDNYVDDSWVCYTLRGSYDLSRCDGMLKANITSNCTGAANVTEMIQLAKPEGFVFFNVIQNGNGRIEYVEFIIRARPKFDQPADPITNPETLITTRVKPQGHS